MWSYGGCTQLHAAKVLASFLDDVAPGCEVIVHRDRDFLSEAEVETLREKYEGSGFKLFVTIGTDIESHYLTQEHLSKVYPMRSEREIGDLLESATRRAEEHSIRIMTNARFREAERNWNRKDRYPEAGNIAVKTRGEYELDPVRFRHGKQTLREFFKLAQAEWGGTRDVVMNTNGLHVQELGRVSFIGGISTAKLNR